VPSLLLTRVSVAQTLPVEGGAEALSSTFHRRLLPLLCGRAIIGRVNPFAVIVTAAGLALSAAACGGSPSRDVAQLGSTTTSTRTSPSSTTSAQSGLNAALAFSRCMRSHGVPSFPDPDSQGNFPRFSTGVSKQVSAAADDACKHLLSHGGGTATPEQRRQKLAFGLKVAQCLRGHGFPNFPDPNGSNEAVPPDIDVNSPQFQTAQTACEKQAKHALGLP
jgi:hypothetical protein